MWANHNERKGSISGAGDDLDSQNGSSKIMSGGSGSGKEKNAKASARISLSGSKQGQRSQDPLASTDMKQVFNFGSKGYKLQANGRPKSSAGTRPAGAILDELNGGNESFSDSEQSISTLTVLDLPENVIETLFTFLPLSDIRNCALVCKHWCNVLSDENNEVWRSHCYKRMNRDIIHGELLSSCSTYKSKIRALFHAWNPQDCSRNVFVKPSGFTLHRNPVAQSTDGARGKIGFSRGRHAWEVIWEGPLGTVAVVGIATKQAEMRAQGYVALLGQDEHSWGWNLVENYLLHNGDSQGNYPLVNNAPRYQVGEKIRVILDCDDNTLSFEKNYEFLGVAFRGLPKQELFPAISAVYGNTEVSMVYLGPPLDG